MANKCSPKSVIFAVYVLVLFALSYPATSQSCGDDACDQGEGVLNCGDCLPKELGNVIIYGWAVDRSSNPLGNQTVIAEWLENGKKQILSKQTLTKIEALGLYDENLEGMYFFTDEDVGSAPSITVKTEPLYHYEEVYPKGYPTQVGDIIIDGAEFQINEKEIAKSYFYKKAKSAGKILSRYILYLMAIL